jgi:hypothetical protein
LFYSSRGETPLLARKKASPGRSPTDPVTPWRVRWVA